jgi:nucleoside-diphosphate-sugar epimerase
MKQKNFLVTGGSGFIGSAIVNYLSSLGKNVVVFDNNSRGKLDRLQKNKNVSFIKGDIRNRKDLRKAFLKIHYDTVIHLAYINGTKFFYKKPTEILDVAVKGLVNIFDLCIEKKIKNLFLASSSEIYQHANKIPTPEDIPLIIPDVKNPRYSYGGGKILTELMGYHYGKKFFKKLVIFRPHNVYGYDMGNEHVIPEFIRRIKLKSNYFKIKGTGNETRSFIYISDFVRAFDTILNKGKHCEIYNIGTEEEVTIMNLAKKIAKIYKKKIVIKNANLAKGGTPRRCPDISKIKKLGFVQKISLEQGIQLILDKNK